MRARSSSSWLDRQLERPVDARREAGPPTTEPRNTTFTQSRSVEA